MPTPPAGTSLTPPPPTMTAPSNPPPPFSAGPALGRRFCDSDPAVVGDTRPGVAPEVAPGGGTAPPGRDGVTLGTTAPRPASPVGGATGGRTSGATLGTGMVTLGESAAFMAWLRLTTAKPNQPNL